MVDVLLITAPVGGGKTSVMGEASDVLQERGIAHAAIDVDALTWCHPRQVNDPFGNRVALRNLAHVWNEYAQLGVTRLLLARVVESRSEINGYRDAIPNSSISIVRLWSTTETLHRRIHNRELGAGLDWHLHRATELAEQMERTALEDFVVDNNGRPIRQVALDLLEQAGWLPRP